MTLLSIPAIPFRRARLRNDRDAGWRQRCALARWAAPAGGRGTVCVFAGRGEYIEKYFETVRDLRKRGYAVATIDWRGQGHSSRRLDNPLKGMSRIFSEYQIDVAAFVKQVVFAGLSAPYFAIGPFDWRCGHAARRACRHRGVRTLRVVLADDRPAGSARVAAMRGCVHDARGRNGRAVSFQAATST